MLVKFNDNTYSYYLAPQKIKVGDKVENGSKKEIKIGNCMPLQDIPVGIDVHNVEIQPGAGGKIADLQVHQLLLVDQMEITV